MGDSPFSRKPSDTGTDFNAHQSTRPISINTLAIKTEPTGLHTGKAAPVFRYRGLEQHYTPDFSGRNPEFFSLQLEILQRIAGMGFNRVYMGERWPDLGVRLVDYSQTFPELATGAGIADAAERREVFGRICAEARRLGIEPWINWNVINYPDSFTQKFPDAIAEAPPAADRWMQLPPARGLSKQPQLCPSSVSYKRLAIAQATELSRLPGTGGIECWLTAADCDLFYCNCPVCRRKSMADVLVEFAELIRPVCEAHGKRLALRCYLGGWRCALETEVWREVAARIPAGIEIIYKQQQGDFMNWHGTNPLAGGLGGRNEHVEIDIAGEYRGVNYGLVCSIRWQLQELVQHFRDTGAQGILCRGLDKQHPLDLDRWLFGELIKNPDLDVNAWCLDWATRRYGVAGSRVLSILDDCAEVIRLSMYVGGAQWASWAVPQSLSRLRFILFDRSAPCVPGAFENLQPTQTNRAAIAAEKKLALQIADDLVSRCEALRSELNDRFFAPLSNSVRYLRAYVAITGPLMDVFFAYMGWSQSHSEVFREQQRVSIVPAIEIARQAIHKAREQVRSLDITALAPLMEGAGFNSDSQLNTKFDEPFRNAETILHEIHGQIDTVPASWWSIYPWPERWPVALRNGGELYQQDCTGEGSQKSE